ncbi:hypothetical protein Bca52824_073977 [Brassica carinata]|uniref:Uncharacterized protein n=1 Tax=Brassica carinata TaxID=52824 RepID=A0A8X7QF11_BRACI|nr:hypothetical protein Bca52824_073977 [Brassica carinata]
MALALALALALSAQEFAWRHFLQHKLLSSPDENSKIIERASHKQDSEEGKEAEIKKKLKELQKLLPGGEEMNMEEMLSEIGSYIVCLEMQIIVLKSLVRDNTF